MNLIQVQHNKYSSEPQDCGNLNYTSNRHSRFVVLIGNSSYKGQHISNTLSRTEPLDRDSFPRLIVFHDHDLIIYLVGTSQKVGPKEKKMSSSVSPLCHRNIVKKQCPHCCKLLYLCGSTLYWPMREYHTLCGSTLYWPMRECHTLCGSTLY